MAGLAGFSWPRQAGVGFDGCLALAPDGIDRHSDTDGIVCRTALKGEPPAEQRLNALLADAFGAEWSAAKLATLLAEAGYAGKSLDDWLRDGFFSQHCELFQQRPFIWHIWDGRRDGFHALVNYHRLAAPNGEGRRTLEKLIYSYLGDWIDRQRADQNGGRRRRRRAPCPRRAPEGGAHQNSGRRAALRHLRALETAARTAHRLGPGHQRRRADEHPPVHDRAHAERARRKRLHPAHHPEDQVGQGSRQGAEPRQGRLSLVLGLGRTGTTSSAAGTSTAIAGTICITAAPRSRPPEIATALWRGASGERLRSKDAHRRAPEFLEERCARRTALLRRPRFSGRTQMGNGDRSSRR